jgi:hypothetical protein
VRHLHLVKRHLHLDRCLEQRRRRLTAVNLRVRCFLTCSFLRVVVTIVYIYIYIYIYYIYYVVTIVYIIYCDYTLEDLKRRFSRQK